ncbi:MAG: ethanolamine ammonia-lyase subunit EutC [Hyphomicrobiales bacterium]|nr:ethanolamine ammonia-lyase subunit EutC [Hyphomicrobiales bacterium]
MAYEPLDRLRNFTTARIGLGRVGVSLPTTRVIEFQAAHAEARDAIQEPFEPEFLITELREFSPIRVTSKAVDRRAYIERPDEGRRLDSASRQSLTGRFDCTLILADGLSARAARAHGAALVRAIRSETSDWNWAPLVIAERSRVALGDEIASAFGSELVVILIGERPGLSSPDSLGAYITFAPAPGATTDANRNCVSNIRPAGLPIEVGARKVVSIARLARVRGLTGISIKEDEALALHGGKLQPIAAKDD